MNLNRKNAVQILDCEQAAIDAERMAALVSDWWHHAVADRQRTGDHFPISEDEFEILAFAVRDLAARTHRVAEMVDQLPR